MTTLYLWDAITIPTIALPSIRPERFSPLNNPVTTACSVFPSRLTRLSKTLILAKDDWAKACQRDEKGRGKM